MTFFNPAQMQSTMNSPYYAQLMQQMQGGGMMGQPQSGGQFPAPGAPQMPQAQPAMSAYKPSPTSNTQPPQGFFQQMMGSPQGMAQGVQGLQGMGNMMGSLGSNLGAAGSWATSQLPYAMNSMGMGNTAYDMLAAQDAIPMAASATSAASAAAPSFFDSLLAFL